MKTSTYQLQEVLKGNNRKAFLALLEKSISKEDYKAISDKIKEKGLPKRLLTDKIKATIWLAAFKSQGITLIEVVGSDLMEGQKEALDWNDLPSLDDPKFLKQPDTSESWFIRAKWDSELKS